MINMPFCLKEKRALIPRALIPRAMRISKKFLIYYIHLNN